jgi:hypothetical protein
MQRLFFLLLVLPWWAYVPLAGGVIWLGETVHEQAQKTETERALALQSPAPAPVNLSDFRRDTHIGLADEVHVNGWVNFDLNYELERRRNGIVTGTRFIYVLFGRDDAATSNLPRAVLVMDEAEKDVFTDEIENYVTGYGNGGVELNVNGALDTMGFSDMIRDALRDEGMSVSHDYLIVHPFVQGREVALAPRGDAQQMRFGFWGAALLVLAYGLLFRRRMARRKAQPPAPLPQTYMAHSMAADSPVARIQSRLGAGDTVRAAGEGFAVTPKGAKRKRGFGLVAGLGLAGIGLVGVAAAGSTGMELPVTELVAIFGLALFLVPVFAIRRFFKRVMTQTAPADLEAMPQGKRGRARMLATGALAVIMLGLLPVLTGNGGIQALSMVGSGEPTAEMQAMQPGTESPSNANTSMPEVATRAETAPIALIAPPAPVEVARKNVLLMGAVVLMGLIGVAIMVSGVRPVKQDEAEDMADMAQATQEAPERSKTGVLAGFLAGLLTGLLTRIKQADISRAGNGALKRLQLEKTGKPRGKSKAAPVPTRAMSRATSRAMSRATTHPPTPTTHPAKPLAETARTQLEGLVIRMREMLGKAPGEAAIDAPTEARWEKLARQARA